MPGFQPRLAPTMWSVAETGRGESVCRGWERERERQRSMQVVLLQMEVMVVIENVKKRVDGILFSFCVCIFSFFFTASPVLLLCSKLGDLLEIFHRFFTLFSPLQNEFLEGKFVGLGQIDMLIFPFLMQDLHPLFL